MGRDMKAKYKLVVKKIMSLNGISFLVQNGSREGPIKNIYMYIAKKIKCNILTSRKNENTVEKLMFFIPDDTVRQELNENLTAVQKIIQPIVSYNISMVSYPKSDIIIGNVRKYIIFS